MREFVLAWMLLPQARIRNGDNLGANPYGEECGGGCRMFQGESFVETSQCPVMLTTQLMYPGSFVLRDVLPVWARGGTLSEIRDAAARAYADNQRISVKSARGVFSTLVPEPPVSGGPSQ